MNIVEITKKIKPYTKIRRKDWAQSTYICYNLIDEIYKGDTLFTDSKHFYIPRVEDLTADDWELYEEKPLLTKEEKEYLEAVLKPFKDQINYIEVCYGKGYNYYLAIVFNEEYKVNNFNLPQFKPHNIYDGLYLARRYSLKDLGLFKD